VHSVPSHPRETRKETAIVGDIGTSAWDMLYHRLTCYFRVLVPALDILFSGIGSTAWDMLFSEILIPPLEICYTTAWRVILGYWYHRLRDPYPREVHCMQSGHTWKGCIPTRLHGITSKKVEKFFDDVYRLGTTMRWFVWRWRWCVMTSARAAEGNSEIL
jgi:hypothetical protein